MSIKIKSTDLIGTNGARKSATIRTLLNFIYPIGGSGIIFGMGIVKLFSFFKLFFIFLQKSTQIRFLICIYSVWKIEKELKYKNKIK